jgi:hypothetical protein
MDVQVRAASTGASVNDNGRLSPPVGDDGSSPVAGGAAAAVAAAGQGKVTRRQTLVRTSSGRRTTGENIRLVENILLVDTMCLANVCASTVGTMYSQRVR